MSERRDITSEIALLLVIVVMDRGLLCQVSGNGSSYPIIPIPGRRGITSDEAVLLGKTLLHHILGDVSYRAGGCAVPDNVAAILDEVSDGDVFLNLHLRVIIVVVMAAVVVDF